MPFKKNFNQKCGFSMIQENFVEKVAGFFWTESNYSNKKNMHDF